MNGFTAVTVTVVVTGGFVAAARRANAKNVEMRENILISGVVGRVAGSWSTEVFGIQVRVLIHWMVVVCAFRKQ